MTATALVPTPPRVGSRRLPAIHFVLPDKHRRRFWPELMGEDPSPEVVLANPQRVVNGVDAWIVQTWARLRAMDSGFDVRLVRQGVDGELCVFHHNHAVPAFGVHAAYAIVVRADRPPVPLADVVVEQNPRAGSSNRVRYIPHWPQPGIMPRDPGRGARVRRAAYVGNDLYLPAFMKDPSFSEALLALGVEFSHMLNGDWRDHTEVDIVIGVRHVPPCVLQTKPASKLVNAWLAGVPAILGDEPAYQSLRRSELDYLQADDAPGVLAAVERLAKDQELYTAMVANAHARSRECSPDLVARAWLELFESVQDRAGTIPAPLRALRLGRFAAGRLGSKLWSACRGWRD